MAADRLLDFDFGAGFFELLLDSRRFVLINALFDGLGRAVYQVLGFLQTQAGDFANRLDDVDLVAAHIGENDGELRLLFRRGRARRRSAATTSHHGGRGRGNAEVFFHFLYEIRRLEQRQPLDFIQDRIHFRHDSFFSSQDLEFHWPASGLAAGAPSPDPNLFALMASLTVTARLRGKAFSAMAMRFAGAFSRNMILLMSSSFDGRLASCWISLMEITRPSTTPDLN